MTHEERAELLNRALAAAIEITLERGKTVEEVAGDNLRDQYALLRYKIAGRAEEDIALLWRDEATEAGNRPTCAVCNVTSQERPLSYHLGGSWLCVTCMNKEGLQPGQRRR